MTRSERFNEAIRFIKNKNLAKTDREIASRLEFNYTNFSKALHGDERYATNNLLAKLNNAFDGIFNESWLKSGEGSMLIDNDSDIIGSIPYYNVAFDKMPDEVDSLTAYSRIVLARANKADFFCNMHDNSMQPVICDGDVMALQKSNIQDIDYGKKTYALVLKSGERVVRRVSSVDDNGSVILIPANINAGFVAQTVKLEDIAMLYTVVLCIHKL